MEIQPNPLEPIHTNIHQPLVRRLEDLVPYRPSLNRPKLTWITSNYLAPAYLKRLVEISKPYGVSNLILDDAYFQWSRDLSEKNAIGDWLGSVGTQILDSGLTFGILVETHEDRERLEKDFFSRWHLPVKVFSRSEHSIIDGIQNQYGGGRLAVMNVNQWIDSLKNEEIFARIDRPGAPGESLVSWANVFGISFAKITGQTDPKQIEDVYFHTCFPEAEQEVQHAFELSRQAIEKGFFVLGKINLMDNGCWPDSLEWIDRQLLSYPELSAPSANIMSKIDLEKIDALEAAHDAWKLFDSLGSKLPADTFVRLEHFFQQLKIVCLILRLFADTYFSYRGYQQASLKIQDYVMKSKMKEFYQMVREYRSLLSAFDRQNLSVGSDPLRNVLISLKWPEHS